MKTTQFTKIGLFGLYGLLMSLGMSNKIIVNMYKRTLITVVPGARRLSRAEKGLCYQKQDSQRSPDYLKMVMKTGVFPKNPVDRGGG